MPDATCRSLAWFRKSNPSIWYTPRLRPVERAVGHRAPGQRAIHEHQDTTGAAFPKARDRPIFTRNHVNHNIWNN